MKDSYASLSIHFLQILNFLFLSNIFEQHIQAKQLNIMHQLISYK